MLDALTRVLNDAKTVLLTGPVDLDGDAVGTLVALFLGIRARWPHVEVRVITHEGLPPRYAFLDESDELFQVAASSPAWTADLAIVADGDPDRLGDAAPFFEAARTTAQVDHHQTSDPGAVDIPVIDPGAASATQVALRLIDAWQVPLDANLAQAIFAGLVFDTSVFRYRLVHPAALRDAARLLETGIDANAIVDKVLLEHSAERAKLRGRVIDRLRLSDDGRVAWAAIRADEVGDAHTGGLVDEIAYIQGVRAAALLVEQPCGGAVKVSLRGRGGLDVGLLAARLAPGGGGHASAAGAMIHSRMPLAVENVVSALQAAVAS